MSKLLKPLLKIPAISFAVNTLAQLSTSNALAIEGALRPKQAHFLASVFSAWKM